MSASHFKIEAERLCAHLAERHGWSLKHSSSLEAIAALHGARDWNTLCSRPDSSHSEAGTTRTVASALDAAASADSLLQHVRDCVQQQKGVLVLVPGDGSDSEFDFTLAVEKASYYHTQDISSWSLGGSRSMLDQNLGRNAARLLQLLPSCEAGFRPSHSSSIKVRGLFNLLVAMQSVPNGSTSKSLKELRDMAIEPALLEAHLASLIPGSSAHRAAAVFTEEVPAETKNDALRELADSFGYLGFALDNTFNSTSHSDSLSAAVSRSSYFDSHPSLLRLEMPKYGVLAGGIARMVLLDAIHFAANHKYKVSGYSIVAPGLSSLLPSVTEWKTAAEVAGVQWLST